MAATNSNANPVPSIAERLKYLLIAVLLLIVVGAPVLSAVVFAYGQAKQQLFPALHWTAEVERLTNSLDSERDSFVECNRVAKSRLNQSPDLLIKIQRQGWSAPDALQIVEAYRTGVKSQCDFHFVKLLATLKELSHANESLRYVSLPH